GTPRPAWPRRWATARAIATHTTSRAQRWTSNTCPTRSRTATSTSRATATFNPIALSPSDDCRAFDLQTRCRLPARGSGLDLALAGGARRLEADRPALVSSARRADRAALRLPEGAALLRLAGGLHERAAGHRRPAGGGTRR